MELLLICACNKEISNRNISLDYFWKEVANVKTYLTKMKNTKDQVESKEDNKLGDTGGRTETLLQTIVEVSEDDEGKSENQLLNCLGCSLRCANNYYKCKNRRVHNN